MILCIGAENLHHGFLVQAFALVAEGVFFLYKTKNAIMNNSKKVIILSLS